MPEIKLNVNVLRPRNIKVLDIPIGEPFLGDPWGYGYGLFVMMKESSGLAMVPLSYRTETRFPGAILPFGGPEGMKLHRWSNIQVEKLVLVVDQYQPVDLEITTTVKGSSK